MQRKTRTILALLLAAGVGGCSQGQAPGGEADAGAPAQRMFGAIAFEPCTLAAPFGAATVEAQCGRFEVAEDPANPDGRKLSLNLAWIPADEDAEATADVVFMLAGGPGQAATESYPQLAAAFREVRRQRNIFLLDQRGTGDSSPLSCEFDDDAILLWPWTARRTLERADFTGVTLDFIVFFPRPLAFLRRFEPRLRRLAIGAQQMLVGTRR